MTLLLIKIKLRGFFTGALSSSKKKRSKAAKPVLVALLAIYVIACFGFLFAFNGYTLCGPLVSANLGWLYFALFYILALVLVFLMSLYTAKGVLYDAKDNELLMSMPIKPRSILISRLASLLVLDYLYAALVLIPVGVVYFVVVSPSLWGIFAFVVCLLCSPLLALALTCVLGWALAWITSKFRGEKYITMIFSLALFGAYMYFYTRINEYLNLIIANGGEIAAALQSSFPPAYYFGTAIADGNYVNLLLFVLCSLIPIALVVYVLSRSFIKLASTKRGTVKVRYEKKELKVSSPLGAFVQNELRRYGANPMYILNASLGSAFMLVLAVAAVVKWDVVEEVLAAMVGLEAYIPAIACLALCALSSLDIMSAPSVSLEGKYIWLPQSLPIHSGQILLAKVYAHVVFCLPPALVVSVVVAWLLSFGVLESALIILIPCLMTVLVGFLGVVVNLHFPKLDWANETAVIKQGASTIITMLGVWGILILPTLLYAFLLNRYVGVSLYLLLMLVLMALACMVMRRYLMTKGARIFDNLG